MLDFATLCEALAARRGDTCLLRHVAAGARERELDSAMLHDRALGLLHHLQRAGARADEHVMLVLESNEPLVDAFWGCLLGRIVPVPVAAGTTDEHRRKVLGIFESLDAPRVCTTTAVLERLCADETNDSSGSARALRERAVLLDRVDDLSTPGEPERVTAGDTAFIQYSSGSTSVPKGVVLTHRNLLSNVDGMTSAARITREDSLLSWMPLTHDMGLIGFHIAPIVLGIEHTIMATDLFVRRPALWLELATRHGASVLCSPNFGYRHYLKAYRPERATDLDLSRVRLIFNGAEPISADLAREFTRTMAAHGLADNTMYPVYGLAEASLAVSFPPVGRALVEILLDRDSLGVGAEAVVHAAREPRTTGFVGVGAPVAHCEVRIADDDNSPLPDGRVGHVQIRGDNVCAGYQGGTVDADMPFLGDGWLDTGDLGLRSDGELYITGRAKDMICVHGHNYFPNDLEHVAELCEHAEPGRVAICGSHDEEAATDRVLLFVQHRGDAASFAPAAWALRTHMGRQTGLEIAEVIPVPRIPKTTSGKVQRFALERGYRDGEYDAALAELHAALHAAHADAGEPMSEVTRQLHEICRTHLTNKDVGIHDNLLDIGENSLTLAMIFENIDEIWPGQIDITDFFDYPTIAELGAYLESRLAETPQ